jgi:hypothetical protein
VASVIRYFIGDPLVVAAKNGEVGPRLLRQPYARRQCAS